MTRSSFFSYSFFYWIVAAAVSIFFFIKFDYQQFQQSEGLLINRLLSSASFKNLKLGIDLQGGTRLVLRVDLNKAYENKLSDLGRIVEKRLRKNVDFEITSKSVSKERLEFVFENSENAFAAYTVISQELPELEMDQADNALNIFLTYGEKARIKDSAVDKSVEILRNRLNILDVKGLLVNRHGDSGIVVQLPGISDLAEIKDSIQKAARLEFRILHESAGSEESLINRHDGILPSDKAVMKGKDGSYHLVSLFPDLVGSRIADSRVEYDQMGRPAIGFSLDAEGGREFAELTRDNIGNPLAIIMDGVVISHPTIQAEIGRQGSITGVSQKEASKMANLLRSGTLDAPLKIEQENRVGASLGQDSISQGFFACIIALVLLFIFSIAYYRFAGFLAIVALAFNLLTLLLMLSMFNATLTLPGIAGIVLTVGMAIDSSILIYEKIKEELHGMAAYSRAVESGFDGAMAVILDSNITTFIAGLVLFYYGGPAIKGFAVTLMLGIISTIISGVFFLRSMFTFILGFFGCKRIST